MAWCLKSSRRKLHAVPAADPKRNSTFEEATAKFTEYINKYPQASDLENAILVAPSLNIS